MAIVLGIDPGSRVTGYGVILHHQNKLRYLDSGCVKTSGTNLGAKLKCIYRGVDAILEKYQPQICAMEDLFYHRNFKAALTLGQARGAAITPIALRNIPITGYAPRVIKQAVVGYGAAEKTQVQTMVRSLLKINSPVPADAADALAVAICHVYRSE